MPLRYWALRVRLWITKSTGIKSRNKAKREQATFFMLGAGLILENAIKC
jgi:hypothetical protein